MTATAYPDRPDPAAADAGLRARAIEHLLALYPAWIAEDELARALGEGPEPCARAVRDLTSDGLVHRRDGFVLPTRPAVCCAALLSDATVRPC